MKFLALSVVFSLTLLQEATFAAEDDQSWKIILEPGQTAVFTCATDDKTMCSFVDPKGTRLVDSHTVAPPERIPTQYRDRIRIKDKKTCIVSLSNITTEDSGIYTCNLANFVTIRYKLVVAESFTEDKKVTRKVVVKPGSNAVFDCSFKDQKKCTFIESLDMRLIDNFMVAPHGRIPAQYEDRIKIDDEGRCIMTLSNVNSNDVGFYSCLTDNYMQIEFDLLLQVPPGEPELLYKNHPISNGQSVVVHPELITRKVQFKCSANGGYPKPEFNWYVDGKLICRDADFTKDKITGIYSQSVSTADIVFEDQEYDVQEKVRDSIKRIMCVVKHDGYDGGEKNVTIFARRSSNFEEKNLK